MNNLDLPVCKLSVVIPAYNEGRTLEKCVARVLAIAEATLGIEVIIVNDGSCDDTQRIAQQLSKEHSEIVVCNHAKNQGKGAALRTGFAKAAGDFVAVQDADLEYDPRDLVRLLAPLRSNEADVVVGSRFLATDEHRVLYFWHSLANRFLTFVSNMFTDLNLTDMESCYKVLRRSVIQRITLQENRFGFEPEIVAKIAHLRVRVYEMGISYRGRTYAEGKKISAKDAYRALYCIIRYNASVAPVMLQFCVYLVIGGFAGIVNYLIFAGGLAAGLSIRLSAPVAFGLAAIVNYVLCILFLFRHKARWSAAVEIFLYAAVVALAGLLDLRITEALVDRGFSAGTSKLISTAIVLLLNFAGRRLVVFPERSRGEWKGQNVS